MMTFLLIYFSLGAGVVIALTAAGWKKIKRYDAVQLIGGHTLGLILWPLAVWNNRNTVKMPPHLEYED